MAEPTTITCINGRFTAAHRAAVPVSDRGFRFGDGVFETIRLEGGVPYQWELHLARLQQGLAAIGIRAPEVDWADLACRTIQRNRAREGFLRIAVSRGSGSRGYQPWPPGMPVTYVIEYLPAAPASDAPYRLWLSRWAKTPAQCLPVQMKLAQGMNSTLASEEARAGECDDALQLTTGGLLSETASANLFWIANGTLFTPSLECDCLNGTTRDAILRLSHLPVHTVALGLAALEEAEAVAIANVRLGLHPVSAILPMGWQYGIAHPEFARLREALKQDRARYRKQHAAAWGA